MKYIKQILSPSRKRRGFIGIKSIRTLYFDLEYSPEQNNNVDISDYITENISEYPPGVVNIYTQDNEHVVAVQYLDDEITEEYIIDWVKDRFSTL